MFEIPTSIILSDTEFPIRDRGDFRMVLDCFNALEDLELTKQERILSALLIFYDDMEEVKDLYKFPDIEEAVKQMYLFFNCGQDESVGARHDYKLIDWKKDEQLIASAVNNVIGKDIRFEEYVHWWSFMAYYTAIGESPLSNIISIRHKIVKGKKLEKHEREFRSENPQYFKWNRDSIEQKEAEDWVRQIWNSDQNTGDSYG